MSALVGDLKRLNTKRRWGYWVWLTGAGVILVPESVAAFDPGELPFTTISKMTGHLERRSAVIELVVVGLLVWVVYSIVRVPPHVRSGEGKNAGDPGPARTVGGRLTVHEHDPKTRDAFDNEDADARGLFWLAAIGSLAVIALAALAAATWWDDGKPHYHTGYVLYGLLGLLWVVVPSVLAFARAADVPFPTFFRTIKNFEDWLAGRKWKHSLGPALAWLASYLILTGLVILLLHLTLYPFPSITKILNPHG